jgi:hypothetical protein
MPQDAMHKYLKHGAPNPPRESAALKYVFFSSSSALLGLASSAEYAVGNAYLEALVACVHGSALTGTHTAWGAVSTLGLASDVPAEFWCLTPEALGPWLPKSLGCPSMPA